MREIQISYQPGLADVLHAARVAEGETWKTTSRVAAVVLVLLAGLFLYWGFATWAIVWFVLAIAEWFNVLPLSVVGAYFEFRRNPKYRQRYDLTLSPEAIYFRTDTVSSTLKWDHYSRFWETKKAFVLSYGIGIPTVIPKAAFTSSADVEAARTLLATAVKEGHAHGQSGAERTAWSQRRRPRSAIWFLCVRRGWSRRAPRQASLPPPGAQPPPR